MGAAEVVMDEMKRHGVGVILDLLAKGIGESGKATHLHPERQILALDEGRGYVGLAGTPHDLRPIRSYAGGRAVPLARPTGGGIDLHDLAVIHPLPAKGLFYRRQIDAMPVRRQLDAVGKAGRHVFDERDARRRAAITYAPRDGQLAVGIEPHPGPRIPDTLFAIHLGRQVPLLAVGERPNLIHLDPLGLHVADGAIMEGPTRFPDLREQAEDGALGSPGEAAGRPDGVALDEGLDDAGLAFGSEFVHDVQSMLERSSKQGQEKGPMRGLSELPAETSCLLLVRRDLTELISHVQGQMALIDPRSWFRAGIPSPVAVAHRIHDATQGTIFLLPRDLSLWASLREEVYERQFQIISHRLTNLTKPCKTI